MTQPILGGGSKLPIKRALLFIERPLVGGKMVNSVS